MSEFKVKIDGKEYVVFANNKSELELELNEIFDGDYEIVELDN